MRARRSSCAVLLAASLAWSAEPASAGDWEAEAGLLYGDLARSAYADRQRTNRFFGDGRGLDLSVRTSLGGDLAVEAGANTLFLDGKRGDAFAATVETDGIAAHALYGGLRFSPRIEGGWTVYGRFDLGISILENVQHEVFRGGASLGTETALGGGEDLYLGFGAGLSFRTGDRWDVSFGLENRRYGRLDGREDPAARIIPTRDVMVSVLGFRLAATYRF